MTEMFELDEMIGKYTTKPKKNAKPSLMLFYSKPGSGKTHLAGTAINIPGVKKGLIIDTEGSTDGVITDDRWDIIKVHTYPDDERIKALADARGVDVSEIDQKAERFKFLSRLLSVQYDINIPANPKGLFNRANKTSYDVIVIDTLDVAQDWAQDYYIDGEGQTYTSKGEIDGFAGWRNVSRWSSEVANGLNDHPALGILVVHNKEIKNEDTGAVLDGIRLSGSVKDTLPGIPGLILYLERVVEDGEHVVIATTGTSNRKVTKDRFKLPTEMRNPTLPAIYKYIDKQAGAKK